MNMQEQPQRSKWYQSRMTLVLLGFLVIGGFFLVTGHTAHVLEALPFLLFLLCPLMMLFMHGGHGRHGGHGGHDEHPPEGGKAMNTNVPAYGLWLLVVMNAAVFIIFAFSFTHPSTGRDWRSFGAFSAFVVALFSRCMASL